MYVRTSDLNPYGQLKPLVPIEPLILNPRIHFIDRIAYVKLPVGKFQEKIQSIEKTWKEI